MSVRERLRRPGWKIIGFVLLVVFIMLAARATSQLISGLSFFRVRAVDVRGLRYLSADDVVARLRVDTLQSVWQDLSILRRRVLGHPQIRDVSMTRRLPGTLVVTVIENLPVALLSDARGLHPYAGSGRALPIDPARADLELPVIFSQDPRLLAALERVRREQPVLFARISEAARDRAGDLVLGLDGFRVRAPLGVSADGLTDIFPVEFDLARRGLPIAELDLRYRDQVIARIQ
ncbi:MAG: FtsQ-type POTRA domain-containing protein [Gemmatimonadaceae bacterium]|nr:FtsQ-type POTRA domain-containing protein [Gemmatimonadaceae bacterium]